MAWVLGVFWEGVQVEVLGRQGSTSKNGSSHFHVPPHLKHGRSCQEMIHIMSDDGQKYNEEVWTKWTALSHASSYFRFKVQGMGV